MPSFSNVISLPDNLIRNNCKRFIEKFQLGGLIIVRVMSENNYNVIFNDEIPAEPLNGSLNSDLCDLINEMEKVRTKQNVHGFIYRGGGKFECFKIIKKFKENLNGDIYYYPSVSNNFLYASMVFLKNDMRKITEEFLENLNTITSIFDLYYSRSCIQNELAVTEVFLKETGHDIASTVQAMIGKLDVVISKKITGAFADAKLNEVKDEVWNVFRLSENIGYTVDSQYTVNNPKDFDFNQLILKVLDLHASEAKERNIIFSLKLDDNIKYCGDENAIRMVVGQLLLNAIKYAYGGTCVIIYLRQYDGQVRLDVESKGVPILENERNKIWDFGHRGERARELHVNGSGIGLFTARKIVSAHKGNIKVNCKGSTTTFIILLP